MTQSKLETVSADAEAFQKSVQEYKALVAKIMAESDAEKMQHNSEKMKLMEAKTTQDMQLFHLKRDLEITSKRLEEETRISTEKIAQLEKERDDVVSTLEVSETKRTDLVAEVKTLTGTVAEVTTERDTAQKELECVASSHIFVHSRAANLSHFR
jgi:hypothetical protein